jgi:predicted O-methyltransferase YrrM
MILEARRYFKDQTGLIGAEIGVFQGENARSILDLLPMKKLFLIDPYLPCETDVSKHDFLVAHSRLSNFKNITEWFIDTSENVSKYFRPRFFDLVYIDGNHAYEFVRKDLELYAPLMKERGLIGGHDYTPFYSGVVRAVDEFARKNDLDLHLQTPDWFFVV